MFNFSRGKKDRASRTGSEAGLQGVFSSPRPADSILEANAHQQGSGLTLSPSSSSSNLSGGKNGSLNKKKGAFVIESLEPKSKVTSQPVHSKRSVYRRASSMVEVKTSAVRSPFVQDLSAAVGAGALGPIKQTGSLRSSLTKKELKDIEKKEKKAAKEAEKKAKKDAKKDKRVKKERKEKSATKSGTKSRSSVSPTPEQRYTTDSSNLPVGFDPASLRTSLTPLANSRRTGSVSSKQAPVVTSGGGSGQSTDVIRINISNGESSRIEKGDVETKPKVHLPRSLSDGGLAKLVEVDSNEDADSQEAMRSLEGAASPFPADMGGVHESLIRALSSEMLSAKKTGYDKRQSYISMQMLANDVSGLNFDFGDLDTGPMDSIGTLMRSNSVGPTSERLGSEGSSIYSETSLRNSNSEDSSSSDDDDDDDDESSESDTADDASSVTSSSTCLSSSYASVASFSSLSSSALLSNLDEAEVDMHRRAIDNGAQVELVRKIGKGASGVVWLGLLDGKPVAVKQIELREVSQKRSFEMRKAIKHEVQLLQALNCVHVVRYFGMFASKAQQQVTLIMELVAGLSVTAFVVDRVKLPEPFAAFIVQQVLAALQFLEENRVVHRDVKPDNLLMNARGVVKMIDFGTAAQLLSQDCRRSTVGTPWYCAPEVIRSEDYSYPADIWSLGCTLIELLTGKPPYDDLADVACLFKMAEGQTPPLPSHVEADCLDFLKCCLSPNPATRSTATQLLEHPWIAKALADRVTIGEEIVKAVEQVLSNEELKVQKS